MSSEVLLRGGRLVTASDTTEADLLVRDGKIAEIGQALQASGLVLDASGHLVMPGGIDTHVHLSHPIERLGIETADDFHSGTVAAACGGVTTIIDFALQRRGDTLTETLDNRLVKVAAEAVVDYGLHIIVTDVRAEALEEIPRLITDGFPSFKVMMTYADKKVDDAGLLNVLEATSRHGGITYLHCENDAAVTHLISRHLSRGDTGPHYHEQSRPALVEAEATYRAICLAELAGAPICIAHVTNAWSVSHIQAARERGLPVVGETCPQYLTLTSDVFDPSRGFEAAKFVCSPPMREKPHGEALWDALKDGGLQQVASDHAPFRFSDQKTLGRQDFTRIPNGLPGIETRLPLVFTNGVKTGVFGVSRFVELVSTNPAKIFGMYPTKGSLDIGADADVIVIDPHREVEIHHEVLHSRMDYSPYEGMVLSGLPTWTLSRGEVIVNQGQPRVNPGRGRLVPRSPVTREALP